MHLETIHFAPFNTILAICVVGINALLLQVKHIFLKIYRCSARLTGSTGGVILILF